MRSKGFMTPLLLLAVALILWLAAPVVVAAAVTRVVTSVFA
jgi:hypothetical protein